MLYMNMLQEKLFYIVGGKMERKLLRWFYITDTICASECNLAIIFVCTYSRIAFWSNKIQVYYCLLNNKFFLKYRI